MEILRLAAETRDQTLRHLILSGVDVIRKTLHVYRREELCFSFNGGKDCTVVLHLLRAALYQLALERGPAACDGCGAAPRAEGVEAGASAAHPVATCSHMLHASDRLDASGIRVVYFETNTGGDFPQVASFLRDCEARFGFTLQRLPGLKSGMSRLVGAGMRAVLMGTRKTDPDGRWLGGAFTPTSLDWPPAMRVCPVLEWPYAPVWALLRGAGLPYCSLYDVGYTSLGSPGDCEPNPSLARGDGTFAPAWELEDETQERQGRTGKQGGARARQA
jgi:FAD synthetase